MPDRPSGLTWGTLWRSHTDWIDRDEVETLYSLGHYDGPMTGIVRYEGVLYYAACEDDANSPHFKDRRFWLVEMPEEQMAALVAWCEARYAAFGNGMKWNPDGVRDNHEWGYLGPHAGNKGCRPDYEQRRAEWDAAHPMPKRDPPDDARVIGYFWNWRRKPCKREGE